MKNLLPILLILTGILFYSCKENSTETKEVNDLVISISQEITTPGDSVEIKVKKTELSLDSFRLAIDLIEVFPYQVIDEKDYKLIKTIIPSRAKNGTILFTFPDSLILSNKTFKIFRIDSTTSKFISTTEFELSVLGFGLDYLKDAEFWFDNNKCMLTSRTDTLIKIKTKMDDSGLSGIFKVKNNLYVYQKNIDLTKEYYQGYDKPIIGFGNVNLTIQHSEYYVNYAWPQSGYSKIDTIAQGSTGRSFNYSLFYVPENYNSNSTIFLIKNLYQGIDHLSITIDKANHVLDFSSIFTSNESVVNSSYSFDKWKISCKGVPFTENSDTLIVYITNQEISKYLTQFSYESIYTRSNNPKEHYEQTMTLLKYELLPNSYFYLTMVKK